MNRVWTWAFYCLMAFSGCVSEEVAPRPADLPPALQAPTNGTVELNLNAAAEAASEQDLQVLKGAVGELRATRVIVPIGSFEPAVVGDEPREPTTLGRRQVEGIPMERFNRAELRDLVESRPDMAAMVYVDHAAKRDFLVLLDKDLVHRVAAEMSDLVVSQ